MNLPNKLTILRILLIVPFVILMEIPGVEWARYVAFIVFVVASLTDLLDGKIARKYGLVTNFGKFADPLADKLLVCSALVCFAGNNQLPSWFVIIILSREFIISGFRLVAAEQGKVIAAGWWGKFKTTFQMIMVLLLILDIAFLRIVTIIVSYVALALTIISLIDYLIKNWDVMNGEM